MRKPPSRPMLCSYYSQFRTRRKNDNVLKLSCNSASDVYDYHKDYVYKLITCSDRSSSLQLVDSGQP